MRIGPYQLTVHNHGFFRLDGGAMFGSVPKPLWEKLAPPDERNRILLATRSLILESEDRKVMLDCGCGDKYTEKVRAIYDIPEGPYRPVPGITDLLFTHLHFDHGAGVSRVNEAGEIAACYPQARHLVPAANLENALQPNVREKASYLRENLDIFERLNTVKTQDGEEVLPGISVHVANGHTKGLQWVKITDGTTTAVYPADLIPTSKHLPIPYVMGYDICAETALREKTEFLTQAIEENWIIVFEHDPEVAAARVCYDERGAVAVREVVEIPEADVSGPIVEVNWTP